MIVEVLTGPQGGGKSQIMREETIANKGLYLFALPTTELIDEQAADFFKAMPGLTTVKVYSKSNMGKTAARLTEARKDIEARKLDHAVIFTTHATLMDHALEGFDDWHARIDEAPSAIQAGRCNIAVSTRLFLESTFDLVGNPGSEWSIIKLKSVAPDWHAVERDAGHISQNRQFLGSGPLGSAMAFATIASSSAFRAAHRWSKTALRSSKAPVGNDRSR